MPSSNLHDEIQQSAEEDAVDFINGSGLRIPKDRLRERLIAALIVSVLFNAAIWSLIAQVVRTRIAVELPPATFKRIILPAPPKPPKRPKEIHTIIPPKPKRVPIQQAKSTPTPVIPQPVHRSPTPLPQQQEHNRVLTASGATHSAATAPAGGTAPLGAPISQQLPQEPPVPLQAPPKPLQAAPPPPLPPIVEKPATPTSPTQDAEASGQVYPDIPSDLESDDYQSFVRVKVDIAADGTFTVSLVSSSGNEEVDQRVLEALKRWKWSPALSDGNPVASTERFRFNFEVN